MAFVHTMLAVCERRMDLKTIKIMREVRTKLNCLSFMCIILGFLRELMPERERSTAKL